MSASIEKNDIRTLGYVVRRTNYGEADRILNLITPIGKIAVIAKGVRKEKSKLAGSVELFSLTDFTIHKGRGEMGVLTGAKMLRYYGNILKNFERMELAGLVMKKISAVAESSDSSEYYRIIDQSLFALNDAVDVKLVESWFLLNVLRAMGDEVNFYRDASGKKLDAGNKYSFDVSENCFVVDTNGMYGADEIKLLRLLVSTDLNVVRRVKNLDSMLEDTLRLARVMAKT